MIDDLIKKLYSEKGSEWIAMLKSKFGFSGAEAEGFVPVVLSKIGGLIQGGGLDLSSLNADTLISKLNPKDIGDKVGIDADKATEGLKGLVPRVLSSLEEKSGGLGSMLSGGLGGAMGKLGKMFD